uniref:(northern house mosquito) hypothetical protein n=1 Tax=Culex pipiens TaxID=7175 RepID=A0A8D8N8G4_CULPI
MLAIHRRKVNPKTHLLRTVPISWMCRRTNRNPSSRRRRLLVVGVGGTGVVQMISPQSRLKTNKNCPCQMSRKHRRRRRHKLPVQILPKTRLCLRLSAQIRPRKTATTGL